MHCSMPPICPNIVRAFCRGNTVRLFLPIPNILCIGGGRVHARTRNSVCFNHAVTIWNFVGAGVHVSFANTRASRAKKRINETTCKSGKSDGFHQRGIEARTSNALPVVDPEKV